MDLNYLLHRHQVALHAAQHATSEQARHAHRQMAERYAAQIAELKAPQPTRVAA